MVLAEVVDVQLHVRLGGDCEAELEEEWLPVRLKVAVGCGVSDRLSVVDLEGEPVRERLGTEGL